MTQIIYIAGIEYDSLVDGPGVRTTIFLSGCTVGCRHCHNHHFFKKKDDQARTVKSLVEEVKEKTAVKKITISGGEPLEQKAALIALLKAFKGWDIGLYTSYLIDKIDDEIISYLSFLKTGPFEEKNKIIGQYYGSSNQKMFFFH